MDQIATPDLQSTLSDVADKMEAAAAALDGSGGDAADPSRPLGKYVQFGSKMVYTACYTLSYGVCFPIFLASKYVPKNNELVNGLIDGGISASHAADEMMARAEEWRLARREAAEAAEAEEQVVTSGVDALASA
eukprot:TRINITY_DN46255_c0_g1_i1.p2 TRINITY_DN46255_c0_g1~~TRINITY_DN46255_c0_g1_i1.p2  ORF type:complete len:134 (-),score=12.43 TRINITY_DN46255_c0_g1_i1:95-496(-)